MSKLYHTPINSFYVELFKPRYKGDEYGKYWLKYHSKSSGRLITQERSVKVYDHIKKHWDRWVDNV